MSIEQHAESAADDLWKRLVEESPPFNRLTRDERKAILRGIVGRHIDEATAPLRARIDALEGLGPLIEELDIASCRYGMAPPDRDFHQRQRLEKVRSQIDAILKGGAS